MNYFISGIDYYLPEKIVENDFFVNECGIDRDFLENKVGINQRRFAGEDETVADLAYKAAVNLIESKSIKKDEIDLLILVTENPDYKIPTTACMLQDRLGLNQSTKAFDITMGCSGYIYGVVTAGAYIKSKLAKKALIIMSDTYSKILDYKDRITGPIFGDAAAASIVEACDDKFGFVDANFGTDGGRGHHLYLPNSGTKKESEKGETLYMNGREIFKFAIRTVPDSINQLLQKNNLKLKDIKKVVFHQANEHMIRRLKDVMEITDEQFVLDLKDYGNTIASTIPIAMKNMIDRGEVEKGDLIIMSGFGVGLSWGNILYRYLP